MAAFDTSDAIASGVSIGEPGQITTEWLSVALGRRVELITEVERVGSGQMSRTYRVAFTTSDGKDSVIAKLPSADSGSIQTARTHGGYFREISFYRELAPICGDAVADCYYEAFDPETDGFTLLLEDVPDALVMDQLDGCSIDTARQVVGAIATVQGNVLASETASTAPLMSRAPLLDQALFAQLVPAFKDRFPEYIDAQAAMVLDRFAESLDWWNDYNQGPVGLQHGDCRLDNILFSPTRCVLVDWQTTLGGSPLTDLSYFLGGSLAIEDRRSCERELVESYRVALTAISGHALSSDWCWDEYRRRAFLGVLMAVAAAMLVERTPRGDQLFMTMFNRHTTHILDCDALELLPAR